MRVVERQHRTNGLERGLDVLETSCVSDELHRAVAYADSRSDDDGAVKKEGNGRKVEEVVLGRKVEYYI
jgi:hypothetical protein